MFVVCFVLRVVLVYVVGCGVLSLRVVCFFVVSCSLFSFRCIGMLLRLVCYLLLVVY